MAAAVQREAAGGEVRRAIAVGVACTFLTLFFFVVRFSDIPLSCELNSL